MRGKSDEIVYFARVDEPAVTATKLLFPHKVRHKPSQPTPHAPVIVEVTIDTDGNVTDTHVLQSLKQDIDEKVVATLKGWHFKPATVDGVAISSRQDVHFHFPS